MSIQLIMFEKPLPVAEAISTLPDFDQALGWGVQNIEKSTVEAMIRLATMASEHFRYALAVTDDIGQYLYDMPVGAITAAEHFIRCNQVESLIGHFLTLDVHVIQQRSVPEQQGMMLLVLNDDKLVVGYLLTKIREYADHVVVNNILPKSAAL